MARCPVDIKITKNNDEEWKLELERKLDGKRRIVNVKSYFKIILKIFKYFLGLGLIGII